MLLYIVCKNIKTQQRNSLLILTVIVEQEPVQSTVRVGGHDAVSVGTRRQRRAKSVHVVQRRRLVGPELADLHLALRQPEDHFVRPRLGPRHASDRRRLRELVANALALVGEDFWRASEAGKHPSHFRRQNEERWRRRIGVGVGIEGRNNEGAEEAD